MSKLLDLTGKRFGRLTVIERVKNNKGGRTRWLCQCSCNKIIIVLSYNLKNRHTKSCGCLSIEKLVQRSIKHGHTISTAMSRTYPIWASMIQRCTNPNSKPWKNYGGRGITVCKRWGKFENFLEDMGEAPKGYQIERIKNKKGYYKENCKWATRKEQMRNTRRNRLITYNGKTQCLADWAEEYKINYKRLWNRIFQLGWQMKKALTTPVKKYRKFNHNGDNNG